MKKESILCAKMMARMAKDEDVESLAEMITEILTEPEAAVEPPAETSPAEEPLTADCGPEILAALREIAALLSGIAESVLPDGACAGRTEDETPAAETEAAEKTAAAVITSETAVSEEPAVSAEDPESTEDESEKENASEDPLEELVAEILESSVSEPAESGTSPEEAILSSILEEEISDEDPDERAADALRAALAAFRPQLRRMAPKDRQRFNADVAARMKRLSRGRAGNAYAALSGAAARDQNAGTLGRKIMENRNVNYRK